MKSHQVWQLLSSIMSDSSSCDYREQFKNDKYPTSYTLNSTQHRFPMTCEDAHRHHRRTIVLTTISTSPHFRPYRVICPSRPFSFRINSVSATFRTLPVLRILQHYSRHYRHNNKYRITCCCKRPPIRTLIHRRLMLRHSFCCKVKFNRRWHRPPSNYNRYRNSSSNNINNISSISRSKIDSRCDSHRRLI